MITLGIITYVVISLFISFRNMHDRYSFDYEPIPAKKPKEALMYGFLVIPFCLFIIAMIIGLGCLMYQILKGIVLVVYWIVTNMP